MIRTIGRCVTAGALLISLGGCGVLDVSDPTAVEDSDLANATGADLLRRDAVVKLYRAVGAGMIATGLLVDEFFGFDPGDGLAREALDRRDSFTYEQRLVNQSPNVYSRWQETRRATAIAIPALRANGAQSTARAHIGEMLAIRGFATLGLAEGFCPGLPLHDVVNFTPVYGPPLSTDQMFEYALADLDSAVAYAADSARILNFARIGRARALIGRGRFAEAAAAVQEVPTVYTWHAEYSALTTLGQLNRFGFLFGPTQSKTITVANREGGNGLDFVAAEDPRVKTFRKVTGGGPLTETYGLAKYPDGGAPIVVANGIEARLIEAEAALRTGTSQWLAILNDLRATQSQPPLPALTDPGSEATRVDLLFRERAFWLFGTGHRLGDLRRLMIHYARQSESVFPTGAYPEGGAYGSATSIPFPAALETPYNPVVTGCTTR